LIFFIQDRSSDFSKMSQFYENDVNLEKRILTADPVPFGASGGNNKNT